jgi:membrane-associated protein
MQYHRFLLYNVLGAITWALALVLGGYYLGTFTIVKENMSLLMLGVFALTLGTVVFIIAGVISACRKKPVE